MAWAEIGLVTWLHPDAENGPLRVVSAVEGVEVEIARASDGERIGSVEELEQEAGWRITPEGNLESPQREGGKKILITVSNLPSSTC